MASFSVSNFLYKQLFVTSPYPSTDVSGKYFCVTGANTGLGKEAVRHLVRLNATKVILTSRNIEKGEAAKADIESSTGRKGVVEVWTLDLQDYAAVKAFAQRLSTLPRLDGVVENAAMIAPEFKLVAGYETIITVNVISTFLLALQTLPKLQETAEKYNTDTTLTIVNSEVHFMTSFPQKESQDIFAACNDPASDMGDRYNLSKLLGVYAAREMADLKPVDQTRVIINFLNPGLCHSELSRNVESWSFWLMTTLLARTTEVGSRTLVHAVTAAGVQSHGKYLDDCHIATPAKLVTDENGATLQKRVWKALKVELEKIQPGVTSTVA